ncbi:metabolite traffic protein EboE [Geotalea toluenoxydans]
MLTYCTNIHPGHSWDEIVTKVWPQVLQVKEVVAPDAAFPVGLRVSALAARQVTPAAARRFADCCADDGCFIPTINGFPHGQFYGTPVKEGAYLPDWRSPERVRYTMDLIRLLRLWLPPSLTGSISTLPIAYGRYMCRDDLGVVRKNLLTVLRELELSASAGKPVILALEPEPGCLLETARDVAHFLEAMAFPADLRRLMGVCFDCCHAAVLHEEPRRAFSLLGEAGIAVAKVHLSSAVRLATNHLQAAALFGDDCYQHQTSVRSHAGTVHFSDLADAIRDVPLLRGEWRIHYHLPIYDSGNALYGTTNDFIGEVLTWAPPQALLEIETYTYENLPPKLRQGGVIESIAREFAWLGGKL